VVGGKIRSSHELSLFKIVSILVVKWRLWGNEPVWGPDTGPRGRGRREKISGRRGKLCHGQVGTSHKKMLHTGREKRKDLLMKNVSAVKVL